MSDESPTVVPVVTPLAADDAFALLTPFARTDGRETLRVDASGDFARDILRDAVMISLFSDRRATNDQAPPRQRRGWHGDATLGSRLWLLFRRGRVDSQALSEARGYCAEALAWLVDDGIAAKVETEVTRLPRGLSVAVSVLRPSGERLDYRWGPLWG
jgi:phage gp46-like protein